MMIPPRCGGRRENGELRCVRCVVDRHGAGTESVVVVVAEGEDGHKKGKLTYSTADSVSVDQPYCDLSILGEISLLYASRT